MILFRVVMYYTVFSVIILRSKIYKNLKLIKWLFY